MRSGSESGGEFSVPAGLLLQLVELAKHWGVTPPELLSSAGLEESDVAEVHARLPLETYLTVIERARVLTREPGIGICWGLRMKLSAYGYLGFATMSAPTLRGALEMIIQFTPLISTAMDLRLDLDGETAVLTLVENADFGSVRDVVILARLTGLWRIAQVITGKELEATSEIGFPEPPYHARFAHMVPKVRFGYRQTRAFIKASALDTPLVMADPVALELARKQCEQQLDALSSGGRLVRSVKRLLWDRDGAVRTPREVAKAVHMSPRTLRRKLAMQGSSLSTLLGTERRDRAMSLLRSSELSIEEMSVLLGYGSVQNFTRAFRQWTGETPAAFRRAISIPVPRDLKKLAKAG
jgi:AraC-like DNA-binding protein